MFMAKRGLNKVLAHDLFADYLTYAPVMAAVANSASCPVALRLSTVRDPAISRYRELCDAASPMPSLPQMHEVWKIVGAAQAAAIAGGDAAAIAHHAAAELTAAMEATWR